MAEREVDLEEVGFSSKDVLLRLQASCRELMREVLSCNVGATSLQNAEQGGGAVQDHVTLLRSTTLNSKYHVMNINHHSTCREKLKAQDDLFTATVDYKLRMLHPMSATIDSFK